MKKRMSVLLALLATPVLAQNFVQQQVQLQHPANGDMVLMPKAKVLLQSGHSDTQRWLSWVDLTTQQASLLGLPAHAQFFQQASLAGQASESLVLLGTEGISRYDAASQSWSRLINTESLYRAVDQKRLPSLDFVLDVNKDGLSDFLIPDFQAYHLYLQQTDGSFNRFSLPVQSRVQVFQAEPDYRSKKPYQLDVNQDGLIDIAFQQDDQLLVYLQQPAGFSTEPKLVDLQLGLTPDNQAELRGGDGRSFQGLQLRRLFDMKDLNADGLADIVVRQEQFQDAVEQSYSYRVHYAVAGAQRLSWPAEPGGLINTKGIQSEPLFIDLNGDQKLDFYTPAAEFGIGKLVRALLAGTAGLELQFFPQLASGQFPSRPVYRQDATAQVSIGNGQINLPVLKVLSSANAPALLLIGDEDHLKIYASAKEKLFSSKSVQIKQAVPLNGMTAEALDLDQNGKMDLVLPFTHLDPPEVRNKLHFLLQQ
ncbi:FG-GAP repeat domain-containing protein [Rheinheimera sp.]|uniref:FG-GAP repeat domain-containing protein n=1 Tax=Rheinheimera sp. TaxID=1869214 RepID=UPI003AF824CA